MLVVDASAVVELLARTPRGEQVALRLTDEEATAPELMHVEVLSAVHRLIRAGTLGTAEGDQAVTDLATMPVRTLPHAALLPATWALRERVRITDAFYVACARLLGVPLLTTDARLSRAPLPGVTVTLVQ